MKQKDLSINVYNTLTKSINFKPIDEKNIRIYGCGPTMYDKIHLGNARAIVVYDVLFRILRDFYGEEHVKYARNITDIDDKIINTAQERGITEKLLVSTMIDNFRKDCAYLNCLQPTFEPRVTEEMDAIIDLIQKIIANGHAYIKDGNVLFSVDSYPAYGQLSHRRIEQNIHEDARQIKGTKLKEDPNDFVLWKATTEGVQFPSPWGLGRPGWHIECSAMSIKYLGTTFDLHCGGADLKFPHHENEIAQTLSAYPNEKFALHWMHNGFLTINGEKMSKSLKNFITVSDVKSANIPGGALRLALLSTHYRKPMDFSEKTIIDATKMYKKFQKMPIDEEKFKNTQIPILMLSMLYSDLNTTAYVAQINAYYNKKEYEVVKKALELIGIEL